MRDSAPAKKNKRIFVEANGSPNTKIFKFFKATNTQSGLRSSNVRDKSTFSEQSIWREHYGLCVVN